MYLNGAWGGKGFRQGLSDNAGSGFPRIVYLCFETVLIVMKFLLLILALLPVAVASRAASQDELKTVLSQLDAILANRETYIAGREQRIRSLKDILSKSDFSDTQHYMLNQQLIDEYIPYQIDSAIGYLYRNITLARKMRDRERIDQGVIQLSYLYSSAGIYLEAANLLGQVDTTALDHGLLLRYYEARHKLNDELLLYSKDSVQEMHSWRLADYYARLIVENTETGSATNLMFRLWQAMDRHQNERALEYTEQLCDRFQPLTRDYAIAACLRALVADMMHDRTASQIWFARSAMTDIQLAIRDNASLKSLANTLLGDDDILRAMRYMRVVMDDARFFNSRLRPWQDAMVLHSIERAYRTRQQQMDTMYRLFLGGTAGFLLLAVVGIVFFLRQNRKLRLARIGLLHANSRLNVSNKELHRFNGQLLLLNNQLSEANEVKEEYIAIFLTMCSEYIDKILGIKRSVRRMLRDGKIDELKKEFLAAAVDDRELKVFYRNFDMTFLQLYPTFIDDFNSLLDKEARIEPKKGELLTTELRIFALIRLGIRDSSKIAALLRYSATTIYNYRSKIKGHTLVSREDFEERIKTIGTFNPPHR